MAPEDRPYSTNRYPFRPGSIHGHLIAQEPAPRSSRERRYRARRRKWRQQSMRDLIWRAGRRGQLHPAELDVAGVLADHFGLPGGCFPSYARLSRLSGRGESTVTSTIHKLTDLGLVRKTNRKKALPDGRDGQTSNLYEFPSNAAARPFVDHEGELSPASDPSSQSNKILESDSTLVVRAKRGLRDVSLQGEALKQARAALQRQREGP